MTGKITTASTRAHRFILCNDITSSNSEGVDIDSYWPGAFFPIISLFFNSLHFEELCFNFISRTIIILIFVLILMQV